MELILWRHAEAEEGSPDDLRRLTAKGEKQASMMAQWLLPYLPDGVRLLASPAQRTQQTIQALGMRYETTDDLAIGKSAHHILASINWPRAKESFLIVGHNPALSQIGMHLLTAEKGDWNIKKAAVWWFSVSEKTGYAEVVLQAAMTPNLLKRALD